MLYGTSSVACTLGYSAGPQTTKSRHGEPQSESLAVVRGSPRDRVDLLLSCMYAHCVIPPDIHNPCVVLLDYPPPPLSSWERVSMVSAAEFLRTGRTAVNR